MKPSIHATEASVWIAAARRRLASFDSMPLGTAAEDADRCAEITQSIDAMDRAMRSMHRASSGSVKGIEWPSGVDWQRVRRFAKRFRDAAVHGEERLDDPGVGYNVRVEGGELVVFGRAKGEELWREDRLLLTKFEEAVDSLGKWAEREQRIH